MKAAQRWRAYRPDNLAWREWDDEAVVYDERSGATHLLCASAVRVWRVFRELGRPVDVDAVKAALAVDPNEAPSHEALASVIAELERLALVQAEPD